MAFFTARCCFGFQDIAQPQQQSVRMIIACPVVERGGNIERVAMRMQQDRFAACRFKNIFPEGK